MKIFKIIIHLIVWFIFIYIYISYIENSSVRNFLNNLSILLAVIIYMFPIARKIHEKELKKENSYINKNLYIWSDTLYGGDNYLKFLLEKIESESIPTNLKEIQKRILTNTNESLEELRLMRAYFRAYKERRTEKLYYKSVSTTIFSLVIFVIQSILTGRITTENILESFHPYNSWGLILSILLIALYYFLLPHRGENRSTLIINILDECIEELKEKQKTKL